MWRLTFICGKENMYSKIMYLAMRLLEKLLN